MEGKRFSLSSTLQGQRGTRLCLWRVKDPAALCSLLQLIWEEKLTPAPAKPHASGSYLRSTSQNIFSCGLMRLVASLSATDGNLEPPVYTQCGSGSWWVQDPGRRAGGTITGATAHHCHLHVLNTEHTVLIIRETHLVSSSEFWQRLEEVFTWVKVGIPQCQILQSTQVKVLKGSQQTAAKITIVWRWKWVLCLWAVVEDDDTLMILSHTVSIITCVKVSK